MKKIISTKPSLCNFDEYTEIVKSVWESEVLTNNGALVQEMERSIAKKLKISNYFAVSNCTSALKIALKALNIKGTVIIPAFSWIATALAAKWQGCKIKFCDIDQKTLNLSIDSLENSIDSSVEAVIPVHTFGNPCDLRSISALCKKHNIKIIYDAAHAFNSTFDNHSILDFGNISCTSTHATKIFNTAEGGGIITNSIDIHEKIKSMRNSGFDDKKNIISIGTNSKMNELNAALGIANLKYLGKTTQYRKRINEIYRNELTDIKNISFQQIVKGSNFAYFPIIFSDEYLCIKVLKELNDNNIFPRRYFYPSLNEIKILNNYTPCPISESISKRIICLPSHNKVSEEDLLVIAKVIKNFFKGS